MPIYSFRAECIADVKALHKLLRDQGVTSELSVNDHSEIPDTRVELHAKISQEALMQSIRAVPDGHVMLQTLQPVPLAANSLERNFDVL